MQMQMRTVRERAYVEAFKSQTKQSHGCIYAEIIKLDKVTPTQPSAGSYDHALQCSGAGCGGQRRLPGHLDAGAGGAAQQRMRMEEVEIASQAMSP